jgi:acyl-CoA thioesterase-1
VPGSTNAGVGGNTSAQMLARFDADVVAKNPRVVVILAGTNDLYQATTTVAPTSIFNMVQKALAANIKVIVGTIPPIGDWSRAVNADPDAGNAAVLRWNDEIRMGADMYGYKVADFYKAMLLPDGTQNFSLFVFDKLHPSPEGSAMLWTVVRPLLAD